MGENNEPLAIATKQIGQAQQLKRKWLMQSTGETGVLKTTLRFDILQIKDQLKTDETYWLSIDRSGTGTFPVNQVEQIKLEALQNNRYAIFNNIVWDTDDSGSDIFTISIAPKMMAQFWLDLPACNEANSGVLHLEILGGEAPYTCKLSAFESKLVHESLILNEGKLSIENLDAGKYTLEIFDENGLSNQETFFIQNKNALLSNLEEAYVLPQNGSLSLNASLNETGINYHWTGPAQFESFEPEITIEKAGIYELIIEKEGCQSHQSIQILQAKDKLFDWVKCYPNPVKRNSPFNLLLKLTEASSVQINIVDLKGRIIVERKLNEADYFPLTGSLKNPGLYIVNCFVGEQEYSLKLKVE